MININDKVAMKELREEVFEACQNSVDNMGTDEDVTRDPVEVARSIMEGTDIGARECWNKEKGEYDEEEMEATAEIMGGFVKEWQDSRS